MTISDSETPEGLTFPCIIDVKVFLLAKENNLELVRDVLLQSVHANELNSIKQKHSKNGKYHSFSCQIKASSKNQMDQLFEKLSSHPEVVMVI